MRNWLSGVSVVSRGQWLGWGLAIVLSAMVIGGGLGYRLGGARGEAQVAELQQQYSQAVINAIAKANARREADLARADQLATELAATQQALTETKSKLARRVADVSTVYIPTPTDLPSTTGKPRPQAQPVPLPRAVFSTGFVRLWDDANGLDLPDTGQAACRMDGEAGTGEAIGEACLYDSRISQAEILTNHIDNALRCRAIEATLDKYIQWHKGLE